MAEKPFKVALTRAELYAVLRALDSHAARMLEMSEDKYRAVVDRAGCGVEGYEARELRARLGITKGL